MALPGFSTTLNLSSDSATFTQIVTTCISNYKVYQLPLADRVVDPTLAITVEINTGGGWGPASGYTFDYLFGKVTFAADQGAAASVRVSGSYKNRISWIQATSVSLSDTSEMVASDAFVGGASSQFKTRIKGLEDFTAEVTFLSSLLDDQDPGAAVQRLYTLKANGTPFLIEIQFPGSSGTGQDYFRGWVLVQEASQKTTPGGLRETTVKLEPAPFMGNGQTSMALWGFGV